jgi:hypothetical protein
MEWPKVDRPFVEVAVDDITPWRRRRAGREVRLAQSLLANRSAGNKGRGIK